MRRSALVYIALGISCLLLGSGASAIVAFSLRANTDRSRRAFAALTGVMVSPSIKPLARYVNDADTISFAVYDCPEAHHENSGFFLPNLEQKKRIYATIERFQTVKVEHIPIFSDTTVYTTFQGEAGKNVIATGFLVFDEKASRLFHYQETSYGH